MPLPVITKYPSDSGSFATLRMTPEGSPSSHVIYLSNSVSFMIAIPSPSEPHSILPSFVSIIFNIVPPARSVPSLSSPNTL